MRPGFESDIDDYAGSTRYWLTLKLTDDPVHITGLEHVRFYNASQDDLDDVVFRLYPNMLTDESLLQIEGVSVEGQSIKARMQANDSVLRVPLGEPLRPEDSIEIEISFTFTLPPLLEIPYRRLSDAEGVIVISSFFPLLSVYEQGKWWTGQAHENGDPVYSEVALFDITLTMPGDLVVASSGTIIETTPQGSETTYRVVSGPIRDYALALGRDFELSSDTLDGVTIHMWSEPGDAEGDLAILDMALESVRIFDQQFGAYPFNELDVVEAPIYAAGIEYPGLIYLASDLRESDPFFLEWVTAHEIGHQWWYAMVGNNQVDEPWIDEGLTEYSVGVYFRERYGEEAGTTIREILQDELDTYLAEGNPQLPIGLPVEAYTGGQYRVFVYSTGALFYSHLEDDYGAGAVRDFLRVYYEQYRYRIAHNDDLLRLVEELFGPEAGAFFNTWIYGG